MNFEFKMGFGLNAKRSNPQTLEDAISQLDYEVEFKGVPSQKSENVSISDWPDEFVFSLDERVKNARDIRKKDEELQNTKGLSDKKRKQILKSFEASREPYEYDALLLFHQSVYGKYPIVERFIHFWSNHFTIGSSNSSEFYIGDAINRVIRNGINGKFSNLAYNVTTHPGMLTYLDNVYSVGENSKKAIDLRKGNKSIQIGLNDNLARELLELHTVSPKANYSEDDIKNVAKILAGWGSIYNQPDTIEFKKAGIRDLNKAFFPYRAEPGMKTVFGLKYGSAYSISDDSLEQLINDLSGMDECAEFLATKLSTHFVNDEPEKQIIEEIAHVWKTTGGDLKQVHSCVLKKVYDDQSPKVQWPISWFFKLLRSSGANFLEGWDEVGHSSQSNENRAYKIGKELGQDFWSRRQPDGFSIRGIDWISPEHFERRLRLAQLVYNFGNPEKKADELIDVFNLSQKTKTLVNGGKNEEQKFILLFTSPEIIGL